MMMRNDDDCDHDDDDDHGDGDYGYDYFADNVSRSVTRAVTTTSSL